MRTIGEIVSEFNATFKEKEEEYKKAQHKKYCELFKCSECWYPDSKYDVYYSTLSDIVHAEYSAFLKGRSCYELTISDLKELSLEELSFVFEVLDDKWEYDSSNNNLCKKIEIVNALYILKDNSSSEVLEEADKYSYSTNDEKYNLNRITDEKTLGILHSKYLIDTLTLDRDSDAYYTACGNLSQMDGQKGYDAGRKSKEQDKSYSTDSYCNWCYNYLRVPKLSRHLELASAFYIAEH